MSKHIAALGIAAIITLFVAGCKSSTRGRMSQDMVAKVGTAVLTGEDIGNAIQSASPEDSVKLAEGYVEAWVRRQIKIQEAEKIFAGDEDIEIKVRDYRNSLLTQRLDQYYIENIADTISFLEVENYYDQHKSEFSLDRPMVMGRILKVPVSYRLMTELKDAMGSANDEKKQDFLDIVTKNNFEMLDYPGWINFRDFLLPLPTEPGKDYDYLLPVRTVQQLTDKGKEYTYLIQITGSLAAGEPSPVEIAEPLIRRIIFNQRNHDVVKQAEDSLYNNAERNNNIFINTL